MEVFAVSDGTSIAWEQAGSGRPIVLLHGLMAHRGFFLRQAPLADRFRLISVDLRGHGGSRMPGQRPSLDQLAGDVSELAETLALEGAVAIGWSLGASVLWRVLAGPIGARFAGAVVVDMTPKILNEDGWALGLTRAHCEARAAGFRDDFPAFAAIAGPAIFSADGEGASLGEWAGGEFAANEGATMGAIWQSLVEADLRPLLPRIEQPTLIVHGVQSPLYGPDTAEYLAQTLPNGRAVAFARSGHAPHLEEPDRFNRIVADFAASLPRAHQPEIMITGGKS